jgi:ABC-type nickel/cobalt efflux system permease component RcnA
MIKKNNLIFCIIYELKMYKTTAQVLLIIITLVILLNLYWIWRLKQKSTEAIENAKDNARIAKKDADAAEVEAKKSQVFALNNQMDDEVQKASYVATAQAYDLREKSKEATKLYNKIQNNSWFS